MKFLAFAILLLLCIPVLAQDALDEVADQIVLEEQPKTVEEAMKQHSEKVESVNRHTVAALEQVAKSAVAKGDLESAAKAWEEVLKIDYQHKAAKEFFELIGRNDVVKSASLYREILGTWKWFNGAEIDFRPRGHRIVRTMDGKAHTGIWRIDTENSQIVILDAQGKVLDRLVLGRDGRLLEGKSNRGDKVWAVRID